MAETSSAPLKSTVLRETHEALGARMVPFAGWYMPVQYEGLKEEHQAVRSNVGLFDVSHMGEIWVRGPKALEAIQWFTTNDASKLKAGEAQYSLFPNDNGGIVDDLFVYCVKPGKDYLLCVNAANVDKDFAFVMKNNRGAQITNESGDWSQIAVQGPKAIELLNRVISPEVGALPRNQHREFKFGGSDVIVARTGYTGEDGAEIFVRNAQCVQLWNTLMEKGQDLGVKPIGLGARDTLRTEMKYSLYGHEIDDATNPYEAGLGWVVKPAAKDFIGKAKIVAGKEAGLKRKLIGFEMTDRGIPREGYGLTSFDNKEIGRVTSGTLSPSKNVSIGIAYIDAAFANVGSEFLVDIRGRGAKARVVQTPFVQSGLSKS
ncbi:MAG TPA: glycine cleavage system aminomethyltransferase GcvT [Bdellovibrionales bacterium]|nr:glycine cleavage system aminomethyltransferase GcvT [Bdellovibrionales bacterium]